MKQSKTLIGITAIAVFLVLVCGLFTISTYTQSAKEKTQKTSVVVTTANIPAYTTITSSMVTTKDVPTEYVASNAVSDQSAVVGQRSSTGITKNQQVTSPSLASQNSDSLAGSVTTGMKAMTVTVDEEQGLSTLLKQGDMVDVLIYDADNKTTTIPVKGVRVLALDGDLAGSPSNGYKTVTICVSDDDATKIATGEKVGTVHMTLHSAGE